MKPTFRLARALCLSLSLPVLCSGAAYTITDLGTLGGGSSEGTGISSNGRVTGSFTRTGNSGEDAFLYDGTMHDLGTLGGAQSYGWGVNASSQTTGYSYTTGNVTTHAFLYDGRMHDLGTLGGAESFGYGINDSGHVTGDADLNPSAAHAFLYDGRMHDLGTLPGGTVSVGIAINATDQVTGDSYVNRTDVHAFLYDGAMHDLGTLGGSESTGYGISANGQVTGWSYTTGGVVKHAFLYNGTMHDLGTLGGDCVGRAVNASGQVVGEFRTPVNYNAFLYDSASGMVDLNSLINPSSGWYLASAKGINDAGQISGYGIIGNQAHAFILTPTPEPSSLVLAVLGFFGLAWRLRRR